MQYVVLLQSNALNAEKGVGPKAVPGGGKEAAVGIQAILTAPACTSLFSSALPLLKPFGSATDTSVLDPLGTVPDLAKCFLSKQGV